MTEVYGVDVICNEVLCSCLFMMVAHYHWKHAWWKCLFFVFFLFIDCSFWGAMMYKIPRGGWVSLVFTTCFASLMIFWYGGEYKLRRFRKQHDTSTRLELLQDRFIFPDAESEAHSEFFQPPSYPSYAHHDRQPPGRLSIQVSRPEYQEHIKSKLKSKDTDSEVAGRKQKKLKKESEKTNKKDKRRKDKKEKKNNKKNKKINEEITEEQELKKSSDIEASAKYTSDVPTEKEQSDSPKETPKKKKT
jgi:hypothetical protein